MTAVIVAVVLLGLLIVLGVAMTWQEAATDSEAAVIYGVEDSIEWVLAGLSPESKKGLRTSDVRRILEWSIRYLQTAADRSDAGVIPVAASHECALYVQDRAFASGHSYDGAVIVEILDLQAGYLAAIGALGKAADAEALDDEAPLDGDTLDN